MNSLLNGNSLISENPGLMPPNKLQQENLRAIALMIYAMVLLQEVPDTYTIIGSFIIVLAGITAMIRERSKAQ